MKMIVVLVIIFSTFIYGSDHGYDINSATEVGISSTTEGTIEIQEDRDYFKIVIPSSGILVVNSTGLIDTFGYLLNADGKTIVSDDDSAQNKNFKISKKVTAGTYYLKVREYSSSATGSYSVVVSFTADSDANAVKIAPKSIPNISSIITYLLDSSGTSKPTPIIDDHGHSLHTATKVEINTTVEGVIETQGDEDYFKISIPNSGILVINSTGFIDTFGYLLNADGKTIVSDDDSAQNKNFKISNKVTAGTYYVKVRASSNTSIGSYAIVVDFRANDILPKQKIILLLHGLASSADTWDDVSSRIYGTCKPINARQIMPNQKNSPKEICYRMNFGTYDMSEQLRGLNNVTCTASNGCSGDYSTFDKLGKEIKEVVGKILNSYEENAEIILLGHSRGGLAARAFLQDTQLSPEKANIVGLITTGTPHNGSPLGRFYKYMQDNCPRSADNDNGACEDDWEVIDMLLGERWYGGDKNLDLRTPSVGFLSPESSEIKKIKTHISYLPSIDYVQMVYDGKKLGLLKEEGVDYSLFGFTFGDHPSSRAKAYILNGHSIDSYYGDGIVPSTHQRFGQSEFKGISALHTDEPKQVTDIEKVLSDYE